ncbi:MAG: ABC transporter [Ruminococcaceae bacterium]|nr:ABC transporter [Oscillospiraceae bacterium]
MFAIYKKEMRNYFTTPLGYVFMAMFLAVSGFMFALKTLQVPTADLSEFLKWMVYGYVVLIPVLTMRIFAEERRTRTEQLLLTAPVSIWGMVFAKFLAAFTMFGGTILVGCLYYLTMFLYSDDGPNVAKALGCFIAMVLIGMCFIAVGVFVSSLTESTVIASLGTMAILLVFACIDRLRDIFNLPRALQTAVEWISVSSRYENFRMGLFDYGDAVYYFSITVVFLFLTVRIYESRRYA